MGKHPLAVGGKHCLPLLYDLLDEEDAQLHLWVGCSAASCGRTALQDIGAVSGSAYMVQVGAPGWMCSTLSLRKLGSVDKLHS